MKDLKQYLAWVVVVLFPLMNVVAERLPNFVVIFTDDQGYQDVGCFGSPNIATPHLDQMAKEGMRFTSFYVGAPVCTPSRAALLTGKYPKRLGLAKGVLFPNSGNRGLAPAEITIADQLKKKNYATICIGKWHLGHLDPYLPMAQGFDRYYGIPYSNDMWLAPELKMAKDLKLTAGVTREQLELMRQKKVQKGSRQKVPLMRDNLVVEFPAEQTTLTKRYTAETIRFIEKNKDRPFFVYLTPAMPHIPLFASESFQGKSKGGLYGDTIEEIDWAVGQILRCLEREGLSENTLVVFTSDNGPWLSQGKNGGHALPLHNGKGSTFEGGMRVPCIMRMPGTIPAGTTCSELALTLDLLPTFSRMAGLPMEHPIDGKDIFDLIRGKSGAKTPHEFLLYYLQNGTLSAIRMGDWKLIFSVPVVGYSQRVETKKYSKKTFEPELYNLSNDIGEIHNLYSQYPEIANKMLQRAHLEAAKLAP